MPSRKSALASVYLPYALAFLTIIGVRGGRVLLALYALQLGASPVVVGLLAAIFSAPPMLLAYQIGKLSDRYGPRWPLTVGIVGCALGVLAPYFFHTVPALFFAALMNGFAFAFFNVSLQSVVGMLSTPQTRVKNFSDFTLYVALGQFVAPVLVGFSIDHEGHADTCLYLALLALAPVTLLALRGAGLPAGRGRAERSGGKLLDLLGEPSIRRVLAISSLMMSGYDLFLFYVPIYAHGIGHSASTIGIILGAFSAAVLVVRVGLSRMIQRFSVERVLAWAFYVAAASFAVLPLFQHALMLGLIALVFGMAMSVGQPVTMALSFSNAGDGRAGEAMGLRQTVNHFTRVVGPMFFGAVGSAFGLYPVFWINALMLASGGMLSKPGKLGQIDR